MIDLGNYRVKLNGVLLSVEVLWGKLSPDLLYFPGDAMRMLLEEAMLC